MATLCKPAFFPASAKLVFKRSNSDHHRWAMWLWQRFGLGRFLILEYAMLHHLNRQNRAKSCLTLLAFSLLLFIAACNAKGLPEAKSGENVALSRQPPAVARASDQPRRSKTATLLTDKSWHTLTDGGTPWQVDWSKLRMNLNSEGEPLAAGEGEEPGDVFWVPFVHCSVIVRTRKNQTIVIASPCVAIQKGRSKGRV